MRALDPIACTLTLALLAPAPLAHDMFGVSITGLGDLDGDGKPDLAVGDPAHPVAGDWSGRVWLVSSASWKPLRAIDGSAEDEHFGATLASPGDLDGDGAPDLLVGATPGGREGRARVVAVSGASGERLYTVELPAEDFVKIPYDSSARGPALAALPDLDGDERPDFAVGLPMDDAAGRDAGKVQLRSGADGRVLYEHAGRAPGDRLGVAVAAVGDLDGDGRADVAAGAMPTWASDGPEDDEPAYRAGYVVLLSTKDGRVLRTLEAPAGARRFGVTLAAIGDLDGDGRADAAVASTFEDYVPIPEGEDPPRLPTGTELAVVRTPRVRAFSGASGALLRTWTPPDISTEELNWPIAFGAQLLGPGDLDGDGAPDLVITMPGTFDGELSVAAWSGQTAELLRKLPDPGAGSDTHQTHRGVSAALLADLDGDGHPEAAIGAASVRSAGGTPGALNVYSLGTGRELAQLTRRDLDRGLK